MARHNLSTRVKRITLKGCADLVTLEHSDPIWQAFIHQNILFPFQTKPGDYVKVQPPETAEAGQVETLYTLLESRGLHVKRLPAKKSLKRLDIPVDKPTNIKEAIGEAFRQLTIPDQISSEVKAYITETFRKWGLRCSLNLSA